MTTVAAIDGGKSGLRIRVVSDAHEIDGRGPGFVYANTSHDARAILDAIRGALADARRHPEGEAVSHIQSVAVGLTGIPGETDERRLLRAALENALSTRVLLVDDALLAHAGAVAGPGTVVSAGTGTIVLAISDDGEPRSLDGWGPTFGDRGSGHAIGLAGMRAAAAALDRVGPATLLADDLAAVLGGDTSLAALQRFYRAESTVVIVSAFATQVSDAASHGDLVATAILDDAARDLVATIAAAAAHAPQRPISYTGRLLHQNTALRERVAVHLAERGLALAAPRGDALAGGIRLARATIRGVPEMVAYERAVDTWRTVPEC
ncbi:MAG: ATPase [Microbacterium sp.]|jgi:N-acetylglucosamine kinase-like BadF-type ATPase|uniref:N-acetylglucosamine kinase n=1 Tax=Microbacterium sp. TaxID=51671 RepID=UPI002609F04C|nr:BadF/BadG/BcrA/BcrD ATPase family protein [Microbacterium sp.]MDF2562198.1 ATPase [Microbacterium sp.]